MLALGGHFLFGIIPFPNFYRRHWDMKKFFELSLWEERGFWALNMLIAVLIVFNRIDVDTGASQEYNAINYDSIVQAVNAPRNVQLPMETRVEREEIRIEAPVKTNFKLQHFNPNTVSKEELLDMGIPSYQVDKLINFRKAGAVFYKKEDLHKVYSWDSSLVELVGLFVRMEKVETPGKKPLTTLSTNRININTADSTALLGLKGVGPYYAKKIVEYRNRLGGFISLNQLLEIGRLDSMLLINNKDLLHLAEDFRPARMDINKVNIKELSRHPYINYKQAKALIAYRDNHGPFLEIKQITNSVLIAEEDYLKIAPYLEISGRAN